MREAGLEAAEKWQQSKGDGGIQARPQELNIDVDTILQQPQTNNDTCRPAN